MKAKEIRAGSLADAAGQLNVLRASLAKEKAVAAGGTRPENPGKIRSLKRNIARILTIMKEKERAGEVLEKEKPVAEKAESGHEKADAGKKALGKKALKKAGKALKKPVKKKALKKEVKKS